MHKELEFRRIRENFKRIFSKGVVNTETSVKDLKNSLKDIDEDYDAAEDLKKIEEQVGKVCMLD